MNVTLTHDGKSVELDLTAEQMTALGLKEEKKKTGYERVKQNYVYYTQVGNGDVLNVIDRRGLKSASDYATANYYSDKGVTIANVRADQLMRQLRRFAAENGGIPSVEDWECSFSDKWEINYDYDLEVLEPMSMSRVRGVGLVHFNTQEACEKAIDKYRDNLIWYFTEYEAMLR